MSMSYILQSHPAYKGRVSSDEFDALIEAEEINEEGTSAVNAQHDLPF